MSDFKVERTRFFQEAIDSLKKTDVKDDPILQRRIEKSENNKAKELPHSQPGYSRMHHRHNRS